MRHLSSDDVGSRVSVRSVTAGVGPSGGPQFTDVVGTVLALDAHEVVIERRDGSIAVLRRSAVVAARRVPVRPLRTRRAASIDPEELQRIASRGWPALVSQPLGDWECRAARGFTARANSVAVHGDPGRPLDHALQAVEEFSRRHQIPPLAQVIEGSEWHRGLVEAGWRTGARAGVSVQVADLAGGTADPHVVIAPHASDDWLSRCSRVNDLVAARAVLEGPPRVGFATLEGVAIGRVTVTGEWAEVAAVEVDPRHRRRGLARRLVTSALAWAGRQGADKAYLQVSEDNHAALRLYQPFGFGTHHRYLYLQP